MIIITTTTGARSLDAIVGDAGAISAWTFRALDEDGDVVDLSGKTVTLRANKDSEENAGVFSFGGACDLVSGGTTGLFKYTPGATDLAVAGAYLIHFVITAMGQKATIRFGALNVRAAPAAGP
jgi:hypothetical protein